MSERELDEKARNAHEFKMDPGTKTRMVELGFDPFLIETGDIGTVMEKALPDDETIYGNVRAEVCAAFQAANRGEELTAWQLEQLYISASGG